MRRSAVLALSVALAVLPGTLGAAFEAPPEASPSGDVPEGSEVLFRLTDSRIRESSGLAASRLHEGIYWTHNDSGDYGAEVYAVDEDGETLATVTLTGPGVEARDWEAVSVGVDDNGDPAVFVGDIGDNFQGGWPNVRAYRFPEPRQLTDQTIEATTFTFTYEDGGRDAEAMMVDPRDGRLYVISKEVAGGVYAAPKTLDPEGPSTLTRIDSAPLYATDAAFSPDGSHYAIRTYWGATVYDAAEGVRGRSVDQVSLPESDQGESLAYSHDGTALLAGTEGEQSPVWRIPLPDSATGQAEESPDAGEESAATEQETDRAGGASALIWTGAALAALMIAAIVLLVRKT